MTQEKVLIGVVMGSDSDWPTMQVKIAGSLIQRASTRSPAAGKEP